MCTHGPEKEVLEWKILYTGRGPDVMGPHVDVDVKERTWRKIYITCLHIIIIRKKERQDSVVLSSLSTTSQTFCFLALWVIYCGAVPEVRKSTSATRTSS
jgi:hypothetical protein